MSDKRCLTLWEMLIWTYRDQRAHHYLKRPIDWFLWALADADFFEDAPRPTVHSDAAAIHALVLAMPQSEAELVASRAAMADRPEPPDGDPVPHPMAPERAGGRDRCSWGWSVVDGRRVEYVLGIAETIVERVPVVRRVGKVKQKIVGYRSEKIQVEFCPIDWMPSAAYLDMVAAIYRTWTEAMARLYAEAATITLREHVITGLGFPEEEQPARPPAEPDEIPSSNNITSAVVSLEPGTFVWHDETRVYRRFARARAS